MPGDFDSDFASRVRAWFVANHGGLTMIEVGTYDDDREPSEYLPLSVTTAIATRFDDSGPFIEPSIIVSNLVSEESWFHLIVTPDRLTRAVFGEAESDLLQLYFDDASCIWFRIVE